MSNQTHPHLQPGMIVCFAETYEQLDLRADLLMPLLTHHDITESNKFHTSNLRHKAKLTKATLRFVLAQFCDVLPEKIRFVRNRYGKPSIEDEQIHFNLSHTENALFIAVSTEKIGIDAESGFPNMAPQDIEDYVYAYHPAALIKDKNKALLLRTWTEKEALVKALGVGLAFNFEEALWSRLTQTTYQIQTDQIRLFTYYLQKICGSHVTICTPILPDDLTIIYLDKN